MHEGDVSINHNLTELIENNYNGDDSLAEFDDSASVISMQLNAARRTKTFTKL